MVAYSAGRPLFVSAMAVKASDETATTSALQNDDDLTNLTLEAGGRYALDGCLFFDATSDGPGLQFDFATTQNVGDDCMVVAHGIDTSGNSYSRCMSWNSGGNNSTNANTTAFNDSANPSFSISGIIAANASTDGYLYLRFAQSNTPSPNVGITLKAGSWLRLTRIR